MSGFFALALVAGRMMDPVWYRSLPIFAIYWVFAVALLRVSRRRSGLFRVAGLEVALVDVPMAFVAYVPAVHLLEAPNPLGLPGWLAVTPPFVAVASIAVAWRVWAAGIRAYQSTGS